MVKIMFSYQNQVLLHEVLKIVARVIKKEREIQRTQNRNKGVLICMWPVHVEYHTESKTKQPPEISELHKVRIHKMNLKTSQGTEKHLILALRCGKHGSPHSHATSWTRWTSVVSGTRQSHKASGKSCPKMWRWGKSRVPEEIYSHGSETARAINC